MAKKYLFSVLLFFIIPCVAYAQTIPQPISSQEWIYGALASPVVGDDPSQIMPVAVGPVAAGGNTLTPRIAFNQFAGPVNIFVAYTHSAAPDQVNVLKTNGTSFESFTITEIQNALSTGVPPQGADPWRSSVIGPIDEQLFSISTASLPAGTYTVYLLVAQVSDLGKYYLWTTSFSIGTNEGLCIADLEGNWAGQWNNSTFQTQGGITMDVTVNNTEQTAEIVLDINGNPAGLPDPPPITLDTPLVCAPFIMTATLPLLGDVALSVDANGNVTGFAENIPTLGLDRADISGTITPDSIVLNYTILFTFGPPAQESATLNKL